MSDHNGEERPSAPSGAELDEILADLDFFLNLDRADALPLEEAVAHAAEDDDE